MSRTTSKTGATTPKRKRVRTPKAKKPQDTFKPKEDVEAFEEWLKLDKIYANVNKDIYDSEEEKWELEMDKPIGTEKGPKGQKERFMIHYYSIDLGQPLPPRHKRASHEFYKNYHCDYVENFIKTYSKKFENDGLFEKINTISQLVHVLKSINAKTLKEKELPIFLSATKKMRPAEKDRFYQEQAEKLSVFSGAGRIVAWEDIVYIPEFDTYGRRIFNPKDLEN